MFSENIRFTVKSIEVAKNQYRYDGVDINMRSKKVISKLLIKNDNQTKPNNIHFMNLTCAVATVYITQLPSYKANLLPELEKLFINECPLKSLQRENFENLPSLKVLDLKTNQLVEIVENTFSSLTKLEILNLSHNNLSILEESLFEHLTNLQFLDVSENKLHYLPKDILLRNQKLKNINFQNNKLQIIEIVLKPHKNIQYFNFAENVCINATFIALNISALTAQVKSKCTSSTQKIVKILNAFQSDSRLNQAEINKGLQYKLNQADDKFNNDLNSLKNHTGKFKNRYEYNLTTIEDEIRKLNTLLKNITDLEKGRIDNIELNMNMSEKIVNLSHQLKKTWEKIEKIENINQNVIQKFNEISSKYNKKDENEIKKFKENFEFLNKTIEAYESALQKKELNFFILAIVFTLIFVDLSLSMCLLAWHLEKLDD